MIHLYKSQKRKYRIPLDFLENRQELFIGVTTSASLKKKKKYLKIIRIRCITNIQGAVIDIHKSNNFLFRYATRYTFFYLIKLLWHLKPKPNQVNFLYNNIISNSLVL